MKHTLFLQQLFNQPLMILPDLASMAISWAGERMGMQLTQVNIGMTEPSVSTSTARQQGMHATSGIAVITVYGILVPRAMNIELCENQSSYEDIRNQLNQALNDPSIEHIVFDIDSPGGASVGCFELAEEIMAARQIKPITALIHYHACSAAYAIASACSEIIISESSIVNSIGVIMKHVDFSQKLEKEGVKVTTIYQGAHKADWSPHEPLSETAITSATQRVQGAYMRFVQFVSAARNINESTVKGTEAEIFIGKDAISIGLADRFETPQHAINRIANELVLNRSSQSQPRMRIAAQAAAMDAAIKL